jgi:hypothetical protein
MLLKIDPKIFFTFRQFHCKFSTVTSINQFSQLPPTIGHNDSQLTADGPYMNNLRENCISNIGNFSQRTTTGHLLLGAVMGSALSFV